MQANIPETMPALALRGLAVFPGTILNFDVGRRASIQALDAAMSGGEHIFLVAQRDMAVEHPQAGDLFAVGTICSVRQLLRMPGDNVRVMVEGQGRGRLLQLLRTEPHLEAQVQEIPDQENIVAKLKSCADDIARIDEEMMDIHRRLEATENQEKEESAHEKGKGKVRLEKGLLGLLRRGDPAAAALLLSASISASSFSSSIRANSGFGSPTLLPTVRPPKSVRRLSTGRLPLSSVGGLSPKSSNPRSAATAIPS